MKDFLRVFFKFQRKKMQKMKVMWGKKAWAKIRTVPLLHHFPCSLLNLIKHSQEERKMSIGRLKNDFHERGSWRNRNEQLFRKTMSDNKNKECQVRKRYSNWTPAEFVKQNSKRQFFSKLKTLLIETAKLVGGELSTGHNSWFVTAPVLKGPEYLYPVLFLFLTS